MGFTFEALTGTLGLDLSGWTRGFSKAEGELGKFSETTARTLSKAANTAGVSLGEMAERAEQLANILGSDLSAAATLLEDAISNPTRGLEALRVAGLRVSSQLESEVQRLVSAGQAYDAHDAILNRISESYSRLNSSLDDLDFSGAGNAEADEAHARALLEEEETKRRIAELDREELAGTRQYEQAILDDMLAGFERQEALKRRIAEIDDAHVQQQMKYEQQAAEQITAEYEEQLRLRQQAAEYANIQAGGPRGFLDRTNSEDDQGGGGVGSTIGKLLKSKMPGVNPSLVKGGLLAGATIATISEGLQEFAKAEAIHTRLEAVLRATGNAAGFTAEQLREMEDSLVSTTHFTGDSIAEAQIFLATLKDIKGDQFKEVMQAGADLAAVMGTDITPAVELLGHALVDPEQGMARLRRAGIHLTEAQQEQIKSFMEVNDVAAAQKVIMDEVSSRTAGAAAAAADTLSGKWDRLWESIGNLSETIGEIFAPVAEYVIDIFRGGVWVLDKFLHPLDTINALFGDLYGNLLKVRIGWNEFWGDVEESNRLQSELNERQQQRDAAANEGGAAAPTPAASGGAPTPASIGGGGSGGRGRSGGRSSTKKKPNPGGMTDDEWEAYSNRVDMKRSIDERAKNAAAWAEKNAMGLSQATPEQAAKLAGGLSTEAAAAVDTIGVNSEAQIVQLMQIYKSSLEQVKGFDGSAWAEMEANARHAIRMAGETTGEMRQFYLDQLQESLKTSEKMFTDYAERIETAKAESEKAAKEKTEKAKKDAEDAAKEAANAKPPKVLDATGKPVDELGLLQDASKNDIQAKIAEAANQFKGANALNQSLGIGTPEQRQGLIELQEQYMEAMRNVRDSTGEARAANIEELKTIQDAWAKAYQAIREGSKKTVEQLVEDAKKQGEANEKAAEKSGNSAKARNAAANAANANPIGSVAQMSRDLGNFYSGAFGGGFGGMASQFAEVVEATTDPVEKLNLEINNLAAQLNAAAINAQNFGSGLDVVRGLQSQLNGLYKRQAELRQREAEQVLEQQRQMDESYKRSQVAKADAAREQAREQLLEVAQFVGRDKPGITMNFHGVTDTREMVDKIDKELRRRGVDRSGGGRLGRAS